MQSDYVDYMIGHKLDTYHDIQMKGLDYLRNVYSASELSIRPKTRVSKIDALREIIRAWRMNPDQILARDALSQPARAHFNPENRQTAEIQILSNTLRQLIRKEAFNTFKEEQIRTWDGGPAGN
jgi:hypothetical protein